MGRWACAILLAVLVAGPGCQTLRDLAAAGPRPEARITGARLSDLSLDAAGLEFDVLVKNPLGADLPLSTLGYTLESDGRRLLEGSATPRGSIPARGERTITLPARVRFTELLATLRGVRPGQVVPYRVAAALSVDAPGLGPLSLPLEWSGELPVPAPPRVSLERVRWESISLQEARAVLRLQIANANAFALDLERLRYELALAGASVASAVVDRPQAFGAGATQVLEVPLALRPIDLGVALFGVLQGDGAAYELGGSMTVGTVFGPIELPFAGSGHAPFTR